MNDISKNLVLYQFRGSKSADFTGIFDVEKMSFQEPWGLMAWARFCLKRDARIEVVTAGKELIGYIATLYDRIYNLAIHPKYRRRGLGRMIVHESHATKTTVHENDLQSQLFFRACGFRCVKIRSRYYGNGDTGYEFLLPT